MKGKKKNKWLLRASAMLLVLLLSLCSALSYGIWNSSENYINKIPEGQTTFAWLKESEFLPNSKGSTQVYPYSQLQEIYTVADSSPNVDSVDIRFQCMAHAGLNTVVSDECGVSSNTSVNMPYNDSVIVGTCEAIEFKSMSQTEKSSGNMAHFGYIATIKIDKNLSPVLDPDYPYSYVRVMSSQIMADFSHFFVVGSKYIINGTVSYLHTPFKEDQAPYFIMTETDFSPPVTEIKFEEYMYEKIGVPKGTKITTLHTGSRDLTYCCLVAYTDLSYLSYAKIDNSLEEFLSSDENSTWNTIIANKKTAKESVKIVTVNNIESVPLFASGRAYITQGVSFTEQDYSSGNKVCLISDQLAKSNNIKVGDVLKLSLWNAGYELKTSFLETAWTPKSHGNKNALSDSENYTVAGIYLDDDAWNTQCCTFTPNTVFVPELSINDSMKLQSSLTDLGGDRFSGIPDSRTYILKTGKASGFEAEMKTAGYGGIFYYYDKNDPSLPYLYALSDNFRITTYISTAVLAVFIISMAMHAIVINLASTDKKVRLRAVLTVIIISIISIAISAVMSLSFYGSVINTTNEYLTTKAATEQVLNTDFSLPLPSASIEQEKLDSVPTQLLMIFAVQTGILLLILCISSVLCFAIKGGKKKTKIPYRLKKGEGIKGGMPAVIWYSITQSLRSNVMGMLIVVLVTLSGIFMFLSVSTWLTAKNSISEAEKAYTTIAAASENEFLKNVNTYTKGMYEYSSLAGIYEAAEQSEHVEQVDIRDKCMAYNNGIKTISSGIVDEFTPITAVDYPYDLSVVVGTCVSVEYTVGAERENVFGSFGDTDVFLAYTAVLELDRKESPVLSEEYDYSKYIRVNTRQFGTDPNEYFRVGERYILYGSKGYSQYPKTERYRDNPAPFNLETILPEGKYTLINMNREDPDFAFIHFSSQMHEILGTDKDTKVERKSPGKKVSYNINYCYFCAYRDDTNVAYSRLDGSLEEFLASDKGEKWKRHIEECKTTINSLKMNFTKNLDSIPLFNQGLAYITEGRTFTEQEYSEGAKVCIISAETARESGIKIGDKIDFKFWSNGYIVTSNSKQHLWQHASFSKENGFIDEGTFEVIGIYKAENVWSEKEFFFTPNSAFAPKGSVKKPIDLDLPTFIINGKYIEETGEYIPATTGKYQSIPNTRSFVIRTGHIEAFEKEMESLGYGGMFYYYDQGFSMISPILNSLRESTSLLMYISVAVWIVVMSAFFIIMTSRGGKTAGIMMSLGMKRNQIFVHMFTMFMCIILISGIVGGAIGYGMYDNIVGKIYQEAKEDNVNLDFSSFKTDQTISGTYDSSLIESFDIKKSPGTVLLMCGIQLIVLSLAAAITAKRYSMKEPLALLKGKRGKKKK